MLFLNCALLLSLQRVFCCSAVYVQGLRIIHYVREHCLYDVATLMLIVLRFRPTKWTSLVLCFVALACTPGLHCATEEYYEVYKILQESVVFKPNNTLNTNIQGLIEAFFPKQSGEPICVGIHFKYPCTDGEEDNTFRCYNGGAPEEACLVCNTTFLWTKTDVGRNVATLLLAYHRGFSLRGFQWDKTCLVDGRTEVWIQDARVQNYNGSVVTEALADLTTQVRTLWEGFVGCLVRVKSFICT